MCLMNLLLQRGWFFSLVSYLCACLVAELMAMLGDGLRADKAFQSFPDPSPANVNDSDAKIPRPLMPFLRDKVLQAGTFGVSHTRVPTESRPGHVALIAGLYEDVSAVTTGWKLNPVNFDSVFNKSRHTWSWGSPDILPMFKEGAVPGRVYADTYGAEAEDFTTDAVQLDIWVFDKVKAIFKEAKTNATLDAQLRQDQIVFFLHLLGLDTTGHAYRPYSKEYLNNIKVVDSGVREIVELIEDFYGNDEETSYVFTADHGMSDWGSHGDGHPDNTRTPLIAWGAGVAKPILSSNEKAAGHEDSFSSDWNLDNVQRNDVAQADVAALMAYLIGVPFPVNSVGELPLPYLAASPRAQAKALLTNAREILEMYRVKEEKKRSTSIRFTPFSGFSNLNDSIDTRIEKIERLIEEEHIPEALSESTTLIKTSLEGLRYLQTYNWLFLRTLVTAGYLGWMAFGLTSIIDAHVLPSPARVQRSFASTSFFSSILVSLFSYLVIQKAPITYYAYSVFPVFFWEEVFARREALSQGRVLLFDKFVTLKDRLSLAIQAIAYIGLLQALVRAISRQIFTD
jgi:GPI ethanolamine phosphate transferase 1